LKLLLKQQPQQFPKVEVDNFISQPFTFNRPKNSARYQANNPVVDVVIA
jgi:hypothetical protein